MSASDRSAGGSSTDAPRDLRDASTFAAVATLAAARDAAAAIAARRRGEHPSEARDPAAVRADAAAAGDDARRLLQTLARGLLMRLDGGDSDRSIDRARLAGLLLTAQRLARRLHALHQHLLGLYDGGDDGTDAALLEDVRHLAAVAADFFDGDALPGGDAVLDLVSAGDAVFARLPGGLPENPPGGAS